MAISLLAGNAFCGEDEYPVKPGERKDVSCKKDPTVSYDIYLPSEYSQDGKPLPILITFSPGGGGMVSAFKTVAEKLQIILVGNKESKNGVEAALVDGATDILIRDLMERVNFDPTAVFASGFSGGGMTSYFFSRRYGYFVSGLMPMGGWLGGPQSYNPWNTFISGLLVVRLSGKDDKGANIWLDKDKAFLSKYGVTIHDMSYDGGHSTPSADVLEVGLKWLLENRTAGTDTEREEAKADYEKWLGEFEKKGKDDSALPDCLKVCRNSPRSWQSLYALKKLYQVFKKPESLKVPSNLGKGQADAMFFGYTARAAILSGDVDTAKSAIACMAKIKELDGEWFGYLIWAMCYGTEKRTVEPSLAKTLYKLLSKAQLTKEKETYREIMLVEALSLQGDWKKAKKALEKIKVPDKASDDGNYYAKAKEHIENQKPTPQ